MWQKEPMRLGVFAGLAVFLLFLAGGALAAVPRLERERCVFKPPRGDKIECYLDGKKELEGTDKTFTGAGKVGLWTKADARTRFDGFTVKDVGN